MTRKRKYTPEQLAALVSLCQCGSHAALGKEEAELILAPFGLHATVWKEQANIHPKGLVNPDLRRGTVVEVVGGWTLAQQIGSQVGAQWVGALGRGTEFWRAIEAIRQTLGIGPRIWERAFTREATQ